MESRTLLMLHLEAAIRLRYIYGNEKTTSLTEHELGTETVFSPRGALIRRLKFDITNLRIQV